MKSPETIASALGGKPRRNPMLDTIDAAEIRIAVARRWVKTGRAVPAYVVRGMYDHYLRSRSLEKTAGAFGYSAPNLLRLFRKHALATYPRGGKNHMLPDVTVAQWYAMYRELGTLRAVAQRVGRTRSAVGRALKSHGWPVDRRGTFERRQAA